MELTSLEPRRKGLTQLYLDGEPGPKLDTEVVLLARLQPGDILSEEELQQLVERSDATEEEAGAVADELDRLGVEELYTGHCTGQRAFDLLHSRLGDRVRPLAGGLTAEYPD